MLSSLSCRSDERVRSDSDKRLFRCREINKLSKNNEVQLVQSVLDGRNRRLFQLLFVFILFMAGNYIQCSESKYLSPQLDGGRILESTGDLDGDGESPCFCDGRFYKSCPPIPSCRAKILEKSSYNHDESHPDHVDNFALKGGDDDDDDDDDDEAYDISDKLGKELSKDQVSVPSVKQAPVVRHRTVVVNDKPANDEPVIFPLSITIPVNYKEEPDVVVPPPKPLFKMRKYTTYETKPVVEKVPVTTTIIKPIGVSEDQIITTEA